MCNGHGQCDYPVCICDRGYTGYACENGGSIKVIDYALVYGLVKRSVFDCTLNNVLLWF